MKRLTDWNRSLITDSLSRLLKRLDDYLPFPEPCGHTAGKQLLIDATPPRVRELVEELEQFKSVTLGSHYYHFVQVGIGHRLRVDVTTYQADRRLVLDHPRYPEILEWLERKKENYDRWIAAYETVDEVVKHATTAGQIIRVLPYLETYLPPKVAAALADRERASRRPSGCEVTSDDVDYLHTSLAFAQLLPEEAGQTGVFTRAV